jgi:WD40-like Beta Propeller Repeat
MSDPRDSERDRPAVEVSDGRLDSWKEIANYLRRSERTVRRWEQTTGLPIHRLPQKRASVYAFRSELDAWWHKHGSKLEPGQPGAQSQAEQSVRPNGVPVLIAVSSAVAVMLAVLLWQVLKHEMPRQPSFTPLTFHAGNTTFPAVSRDGKLLAFASDRGPDKAMDLWVQPVAGGQAVRVTRHGGTNRHLDFSPDGST